MRIQDSGLGCSMGLRDPGVGFRVRVLEPSCTRRGCRVQACRDCVMKAALLKNGQDGLRLLAWRRLNNYNVIVAVRPSCLTHSS